MEICVVRETQVHSHPAWRKKRLKLCYISIFQKICVWARLQQLVLVRNPGWTRILLEEKERKEKKDTNYVIGLSACQQVLP
jgi:hypothetical protein